MDWLWDMAATVGDALNDVVTPRAPDTFFGGRWVELGLVSVIFTGGMLLVAKAMRLSGRLRQCRRGAMAALQEMMLYRRRPLYVLAAEGRLLACSGAAMIYLLPVLLIGAMGFGALYPTLANRYAWAPARAGEDVVVTIQANADRLVTCRPAGSTSPLAVTARVRNRAARTTWARFRAGTSGSFPLTLSDGGQIPLNVGRPGQSATRHHRTRDRHATIHYGRAIWWGWEWGWLVFFVAGSIVATPVLGRLLRVQM